MKRIICILISLSLLLSSSLAAGDVNVDGDGGGSTGTGTGKNNWTPGNDGVRITVVEEKTGMVVSKSVDFASKPQKTNFYFGYISKRQYCNTGKITPVVGANYENITPVGDFPQIVSPSGNNNIEAVKRYFSAKDTIEYISPHLGIEYDNLTNGNYALLIEPIIYFVYNGTRYAATATEVALFDKVKGGAVLDAMGTLTHVNLPRSMYLMRDAIGFKIPRKPFPYRSSNNQIIETLGLGSVHFKPIDPIIPPEANYIYHTDTDVITSVMVTASNNRDPDNMGYVTFNILGTTYTKKYVVPINESQLVWVKWRTPPTPQVISISLTSTDTLSTRTISANIITPKENPPPNPIYEDPVPKIDLRNTPIEKNSGKHTWTIWTARWVVDGYDRFGNEVGHWEYTKTDQSAWLETTAEIKPNSRVQTAFSQPYGRYDMKSGYGVDISYKGNIWFSCNEYDFTTVQNASATFAEFDFKTYNRLLRSKSLDRTERTMEFKENKYSYYLEPVHFTPLRYPDRTDYVVSVESFDAWTPLGQLKSISNADNIEINGNVYDDWYVRPIRE